MIKSYKDLRVWQLGIDLAINTYEMTRLFPKSELFGLTSQMCRAASSVPANISEGSCRQYKNEFIQFLYIARGSLGELETFVIISQRLGFLDEASAETLTSQIDEVGKMLNGLISSLRQRK